MTTGSAPLASCSPRKVSKARVLKFVEQQFELADADRDGALTPAELTNFLHLLAHPARRGGDMT